MHQILIRLAAALLLGLFLGRVSGQADTLLPAFDTPYAERSPVLSPDGDWLFFVVEGHPQNLGLDDEADIWVAQRQPDGRWGRVLNAGPPLNSRRPDDIAACGPAAAWLLLFRPGQAPRMAVRQGRSWALADSIDLPGWGNWESTSHCFLNAQADLLLLSARREGGSGGLDLYASRRRPDGKWGEAFNLGPAINTVKDESSPWMSPDGTALYFAQGRGRQMEWMLSRRTTWDGAWPAPVSTGIRPMAVRGGGPIATLFPDGQRALMGGVDSSGLPALRALPLPEAIRFQPVNVVRGHCNLPVSSTHPAAEVYCQWLERPEALLLPLTPNGNYCALTASDIPALIGARLPGHISPPLVLGLPPEQLDEDPGRGAVILSPEYYQREANLKSLQTRYAAGAAALSERRSAWEDKFTSLFQPAAALLAAPLPELRRQAGFDYEAQIRWDTSRRQPLPFDSIFTAAQGKALSAAAAQVVGEQLNAWLTTRQEGDSRPWADIAQNLRRSIESELKGLMPPQPTVGYMPWQIAFQDSLSATMTPLLYSSLQTAWKPLLPELLSLALDARSAELGQTSLEAELERLVLEQIKEEENRGAFFADAAPPLETPSVAPVSAKASAPADLAFIPLRVGVVVPFEYVYFVPNAPRLRSDAALELNHWIDWLRAHPEVKIRIGCHSHDGMGHALAYRLSVQRARAILDYLTARGVGRDRLSAKGYGKMAPLDPGDTAIARKKNQRVEITILAAP